MKVQHTLAFAVLAVLGAGPSLAANVETGLERARVVQDGTAQVADLAAAEIRSSAKFQRLVQLPAGQQQIEYRHQIALPAGARVLAGLDEAGQRELRSDVEIVDAHGVTIGYVDAAWAQDTAGSALPSHFRIEGNTLVQVIDARLALGEVTALLQFTGIGAEAQPEGTLQAKAYVGIPSNYVYNLNHPRKTLHDYCTKSPDEFPNPVGANANFRGPCARHDMCFEQKQASEFTCNNRLWSNLVSNCEYTYAWYNPVRQTCINTAHVYWIAVTANTLWPW